jgi:hypothetical protein
MAQSVPDERLTGFERAVAFVLGVALIGMIILLMIWTPSQQQAMANCTVTRSEDCVSDVSTVPDALTAVLAASAGVFFLVSILAVRPRSIRAGVIEVGGTTSSQQPDKAP